LFAVEFRWTTVRRIHRSTYKQVELPLKRLTAVLVYQYDLL
jgi:hypothetical protein